MIDVSVKFCEYSFKKPILCYLSRSISKVFDIINGSEISTERTLSDIKGDFAGRLMRYKYEYN